MAESEVGATKVFTSLGEIPLFAELPAETVAVLEPLTVKKSFKAGENLIEVGDSGDLFYLIHSGTAQVFREPSIHLMDRHAGDWFGGKNNI